MASANRRVLPGFSLTLGYTVFYLSILVLLPIAAIFFKTAERAIRLRRDPIFTDFSCPHTDKAMNITERGRSGYQMSLRA